jgi:hypothetical protein
MPCNDITELIRVVLDDSDRLLDYRFVKRTCGQGVGVDTLLLPVLAGQRVDEILAISPEQFLEVHPCAEAIEEFLALKHLIAVQAALEVLTGRASGGPGELCAAAEISYENGACVLEARITVEAVTEKIRSCGGCRGCGKVRTAGSTSVF